MSYIRKSPKKAVVDGEDKHPYMKGYATWRTLQFWHKPVIHSIDGTGLMVTCDSREITQSGKDYLNDSLNRMSKVYNLTKVDQSFN